VILELSCRNGSRRELAWESVRATATGNCGMMSTISKRGMLADVLLSKRTVKEGGNGGPDKGLGNGISMTVLARSLLEAGLTHST
jgi:hypothetical protein